MATSLCLLSFSARSVFAFQKGYTFKEFLKNFIIQIWEELQRLKVPNVVKAPFLRELM
ncbi:hypothetical protein PPM_p0163 (plasmid) [Paenibacillus polymyxa M1]|nr:hypothetical protein PPM_p0163 [Paenibacillus polymyxa M1]